MKVALVVGHSVVKQGASHERVTEFDFNDQLMVSMYESLPKHHTFATFYRSSNIKGYTHQMIDLHKRLEKWGCDLAIEFHLNDFHNPDVDGHEVLAVSYQGKLYADKLNDKFNKYLPNKNRGVKLLESHDNGYGFLVRGEYPCIISEPFFISSIGTYLHGEKDRHKLIKSYIEFLEEL
jgi:hypothetical protein